MYPEQFASTFERRLYEALAELVADLDLKNFPRPHIESLLRDFEEEQKWRLEVRRQMESYRLSKK